MVYYDTVYPFPFLIKLFIDFCLYKQASIHPLTIFDV